MEEGKGDLTLLKDVSDINLNNQIIFSQVAVRNLKASDFQLNCENKITLRTDASLIILFYISNTESLNIGEISVLITLLTSSLSNHKIKVTNNMSYNIEIYSGSSISYCTIVNSVLNGKCSIYKDKKLYIDCNFIDNTLNGEYIVHNDGKTI